MQFWELSNERNYRTTIEDGVIKPIEEPEPVPTIEAESAGQLLSKDIKPTRLIVGDSYDHALLTEGTCIIASKPKVGKSYFAMTMALAVAGGHEFLGYQTNKCGVLYFDFETNDYTRQRRLRNILEANKWEDPGESMQITSSKARIGEGFEGMLAEYLAEHEDVGLVVVDMYQQVVDEKKSVRENDYEQAYRNFDALNELARWFGIALVIVMHSRKEVSQDDPFSNILGSVGLQGATDQMLTLGRRGLDGPIRVWGKAKTHDSSPMLTLRHERSLWRVVDNSEWDHYQEQADNDAEYYESDIRKAVIAVIANTITWRGRAREFAEAAVNHGVGLTEGAKEIGLFLTKYSGMFLKKDGIWIKTIKNGSGGKTYEIREKDLPEGFEQISTDDVQF